jgi:iron complex outermembrane receptor protein
MMAAMPATVAVVSAVPADVVPASAGPAAPQPPPPPTKLSAANAVAQAEDAFGASIGQETVGIYSDTDVRGFNPQRAGNSRMDGVYFDQYGIVPTRLREGSDIRVGFAALNYPSPAPTGILAHRLRPVGDKLTLNFGLTATQYGGYAFDFYTQIPIVKDHFAIGTGESRAWTGNPDGAIQRTFNISLIAPIRFDGIEIKPIFSGSHLYDGDTRPIVVVTGPFVPHTTRPGRNLAQRWAKQDSWNINFGSLFTVPLTGRLAFRGGFIQSRTNRLKNYTEIFAVRDAIGHTSHSITIDPVQKSYANSWDALFSYRLGEGRLRHNILLQYKGRRRHIESGGSDFVTLCDPSNDCDLILGKRDQHPKPVPVFGKLVIATLRQDNFTLGYIGRLDGVGQVNLGVTKTIYHAAVRGPNGPTSSGARPWLYNASVMVRPLEHVALYAGYVTGLEDSGTAPESATNRNEQLPASPTRQIDAGIKLDVGLMHLVASVFEIKKPYFSFDAGRYVEVGDVRHRGVEFSASGKLTSRLQILGGAVLMKPQVSGAAVKAGLLGKLPAGTPKLHARIDANYRTDIFGGLTFTAAMLHDGRRALSSAPYAKLGGRQVMLPAHTTFDLGIRQAFTLGRTPVSFRFSVNNIFDSRGWKVIAPNTVQLDDTRRYNFYFFADF